MEVVRSGVVDDLENMNEDFEVVDDNIDLMETDDESDDYYDSENDYDRSFIKDIEVTE